MPKKSKDEPEKTKQTELQQSNYGALMVKSLHQAMRLIHFNADDVWFYAIENGVDETEAARLIGGLLKQYKHRGYIHLSKKFKLSRRTSRPLPTWVASLKIQSVL